MNKKVVLLGQLFMDILKRQIEKKKSKREREMERGREWQIKVKESVWYDRHGFLFWGVGYVNS